MGGFPRGNIPRIGAACHVSRKARPLPGIGPRRDVRAGAISGQSGAVSHADLGTISGRFYADLGPISGRSRVDLGTISGRSRADLGAISASPNVTIVNVARRAHALDLPPATWRRSFIILHSHSFVVHFFISDAQDFVPSEFEARVYVVRGVIAHIIYSNFDRVDPDGDHALITL